MSALLEANKLTVSFGGLRAVDGVDVSVHEGSLVGLIGPNGAGKTTFIDALTGFVPSSGRLRFGGRQIDHVRPYKRSALGLVRTWQSVELFDDLTVWENVVIASERSRATDVVMDLVRPSRRSGFDEAQQALRKVGLEEDADRMPTELPQSRRKLVGVARALAGCPRLVLMDEPASGLDGGESAVLGHLLRQLVDSGLTIFLVDHDMGLVLTVCDYIYVLEFGQVIAEGAPSQIRTNERVIEAYLGHSRAARSGKFFRPEEPASAG